VPEGATLVLVPGDRPSRAVGSGEGRAVVRAEPRRLLRWLVGRGGDPSWPALGPWGG
jgi:maleylpyruvate isomerase